jgi:class 3 adenylate cyclase
MKRFRSSLRYKLGLIMLLLSLGPLVAVAVITLTTVPQQIRQLSDRLNEAETALRSDVVGRNLVGAAADTAAEIDSYLLERIKEVRRWSEEPVIIEAARQGSQTAQTSGLVDHISDPAAVQAQLAGGLYVPIEDEAFSEALSYVFLQTERAETPYVEILLTEVHGINVILTRPTEQIVHTEAAWWQAARDPSQAGIGLLPTRLDATTGEPEIGIALPVIDPDTKEVLGIIRTLVRLQPLQARLSQKAASANASIRVINSDGLLIADTTTNHAAASILNPNLNLLSPVYPPAQQALAARPGIEGANFMLVSAADGSRGNDIVGYAHTGGSDFYDSKAQLAGFNGFDWGITVAQPEQRALQVLSNLIATAAALTNLPTRLAGLFIGVTLLAAVLGFIGALLISGQITGPLIELSHMAQNVQAGDLAAQVTVRSTDEVGVLGSAFNQMAEGLRQRERERDIFGRVVSPQVREKLLSGNLELGGETRWVTVLFSDIRNFSTMSEQMSPQDVVAFLNEYLSEMSEAIQAHDGYINNFIGDAIVAIFGAPLEQPAKEHNAVAAALEMRRRLEKLNQRRQARGEAPIQSGIGISAGYAVAGQIGSLDRLLYTVIGDAVNVAARLEGLTKDYPHQILINGALAKALQTAPGLEMKALGQVPVKGRAEAVDLYAVIDWKQA